MGGMRHGCLGRHLLNYFDREPQGDVESAQLHGFKLGTDRSDKNCSSNELNSVVAHSRSDRITSSHAALQPTRK